MKMSVNDKSKQANTSSHVSAFPAPPWQIINKHFGSSAAPDVPPRPPTPPGPNAYRMFGNFYNAEDSIPRSLESQGVRRVYPQNYNRKRELRKINFSILTNYLDLLDVITRDPSSTKRTEKLDHLAILFINMHHLVNEYRQHQARDLLREILKYQVSISSETVEKAEQYLSRADDILKSAGADLILPGSSAVNPAAASSQSNPVEIVRISLNEFGPDLAPLLQSVLNETGSSTDLLGSQPKSSVKETSSFKLPPSQSVDCFSPTLNDCDEPMVHDHLDAALWQFLVQANGSTSDVESESK